MAPDEVFSLLYVNYVDDLYYFGISMGYGEDAVRDAIHDVFLKLFSSRTRYEAVKNWKAYLFRSLNNRLVDLSRHPADSLESDRKGIEALLEDSFGEREVDETKSLVANRLTCLINSLPYRQKLSIHLRFFEEMSYDEIAEVLRCSNHAARISVSKAIQNLRKYNLLMKLWQE